MAKRVAFFTGSFYTITNGHADIVQRGLKLFDEIVIGIGTNSAKKRYFDLAFIEKSIRVTFQDEARVRIVYYDNLTAQVATEQGAQFILRGLRNTTDFEYENTISQVNRKLASGLETVFLITSPEYAPISSTIVRELHKYGADISPYLPFSAEIIP